ncbi:MAG: Adenylyl cyclase CyaB [Parcubacteria group bacterium GW2011_GWA2_50_10b]|nr:MAG: Adenylyl cyclase CyaB [Parcubacteria group bacterium GW2011_GWA2_50_10b]
MREIEIKLRANNLKEVESKLAEKGCVLSEPISQHDVVYSLKGSRNEFQSAQEGDIVIRIRYLKDSAELTLKQQRSNESDNIECETEVVDPKQIHHMLELLGWYPAVEVKKIRRKGKLGLYEICLDEVERLGTFIELEKLTDENIDAEEVRQELFKELESLGLSRNDEETRGYDTQIYQLELNK